MQQLVSVFGLDWKLFLIQGLNFGVLLLLLWYFLYRPVLRIIDERREKVAEGVRLSEAAERKLADAEEEGKGIVGSAAREAEGLVATARTRAEEKGSDIVKSAEVRAEALLKDAEARAEEMSRQSLAESQKEIARVAMLAAEKILREKSA